MDKQDEIEWCPTQSGTYIAYKAEWRNGEKWETISAYKSIGDEKNQVPASYFGGAVNECLSMQDYEQAMAIAWGFAADASSKGHTIGVRVQPYKIVYDLKARKTEESELDNEETQGQTDE